MYSWRPPTFICSTSCAFRAQQCLEQARETCSSGQVVLPGRGVFSGGRDPHRPRLPVPGAAGGDRSRARPPSTFRTRSATRMPAEFGELIQMHSRAGAGNRERDDLGALPQRSRTGGGELAGGAGRGRAPGGVHDQRHRRARGECVARRNRDGDAGAAGPLSL